jgi:beta-N-acetylhexosaminidase
MHRWKQASLAVLVGSLVLAPALPGAQAARRDQRAQLPLSQLVGQHLMGTFTGTRPSAELLSRIERGRLGAVILRGQNISSASSLRTTIAELQRAAQAGGQPPLLVAIDQEGGSVKRLASAPPYQSAAELGASGDGAQARAAGLATGRSLRSVGVNVDFAPVLDVPASARSFLGSRTFGRDPATVEQAGVAFADGLEAAGIASTAKHFPGLGTAPANTDGSDVTVKTSRAELIRRLAPFRAAIDSGVRLVMVSSARYPVLDSQRLPALLSAAIVDDLLRRQLGFRGVVVTDTMGAPSVVPFPLAPARAIRAGVDLLLYPQSEKASSDAFVVLIRAARSGAVSRAALRTSYDRILRLKSSLQR